MNSHFKTFLLAFGFSTLTSIVYSFWHEQLSGIVIVCLMLSVIYFSQLLTAALDVESRINRLNEFMADYLEQRNQAVELIIGKLHRPSVRLISKQLDLVKLIGAEIRKQKRDQNNPIVFVGATSLQTPNEDEENADVSVVYEDEDEQSPYQIYQGALEEASSKGVAIYRFVYLPQSAEIVSRSREWVRDYLRWLENQHSQLGRNDSFILINSPRSPKWGAAGARIILDESMFDISYKGGATVQLRDRLISKVQKDKIISAVLMGNKENIDVYCSDQLKVKNRFGEVNAMGLSELSELVQSTRLLVEEVFS